LNNRILKGGATALAVGALALMGACAEEKVALMEPAAEAEAPAATKAAAQNPRDYMVVVSRPSHLHLIDLQKMEVAKECEIPGPGVAAPGTVVMSPDTRIAYVLAGGFSNIYGIEVDTCELVFSAYQSAETERVKSMGAIAISPDGAEIYTHQNPVTLMSDQYRVEDTRIAVYRTDAGLEARADRSFPAPRQVTIMATGKNGTLYMGGRDIYSMDVDTGEWKIALPSASRNDPAFLPRDVLTVWNIGSVSGEFIRLYSSAEFAEGSQDPATARWHWGYERVDLETGEVEDKEFGPLQEAFFTGMTRPGHRDQVYAVLNNLAKFDVNTKTQVASQDIDHSYYCINFSTDGDTVYLGGAADNIASFDAETLERKGTVQLTGDMSMSPTQVFSRPAG
jgi:quinohemoprotein amine dehydrogenase beta subunit